MGNTTRVTQGIYAGAIVTLIWYVLYAVYGIERDPDAVAASLVLFTALWQYFSPIETIAALLKRMGLSSGDNGGGGGA